MSSLLTFSASRPQAIGCRHGSSAVPKTLCKNLSTIDTNSSAFSSWGKWPHFLITSKEDLGIARASLSEFHAGTSRSVSPVTTKTVPLSKWQTKQCYYLCLHTRDFQLINLGMSQTKNMPYQSLSSLLCHRANK